MTISELKKWLNELDVSEDCPVLLLAYEEYLNVNQMVIQTDGDDDRIVIVSESDFITMTNV